MQHSTDFSVRYLTDDSVPISHIIASLQGVEAALNETAKLLPHLIRGLEVQKLEVRVREVSQESPLREVFAIALFVAFQDDLEAEVPRAITDATGMIVPDRFDTIVTVLALIVVFYGAGALKDLVFGRGNDGAAKVQLDGLIAELSVDLNIPELEIRKKIEERYSEKSMWRRLANMTSRFFAPSKHQESAPIEVNNRRIPSDVVRDVPADYLVDEASDDRPARTFTNVVLELHAQDRDHTGRGWAAVIDGVSDQRLRMKLMDEVSADEVWGKDKLLGDVTIIYDRVGGDLVPREIHLERVKKSA